MIIQKIRINIGERLESQGVPGDHQREAERALGGARRRDGDCRERAKKGPKSQGVPGDHQREAERSLGGARRRDG